MPIDEDAMCDFGSHATAFDFAVLKKALIEHDLTATGIVFDPRFFVFAENFFSIAHETENVKTSQRFNFLSSLTKLNVNFNDHWRSNDAGIFK
jgi:hypothetical protein